MTNRPQPAVNGPVAQPPRGQPSTGQRSTGQSSTGQWPPEVPPFRPPVPPTEPPEREPLPPPTPILPSWEEPDPRAFEHDLANRLLEQRVISMSGHLDQATANQVASRLILLDRQGQEPVTLHLSCPESDLDASLALADAVDLVAAPVHVMVRGTLRGPAVAVLCAAAERAAHRNTLFVLSLPDTSGEGTAMQLAGLAEQYLRQVEHLRRRVAAATGQPEEDVAADLESGRVLSAEEAKGYGLVNELL